MPTATFRPLAIVVCVLLGAATAAQAQICVYGQTSARVATGAGDNNYLDDAHPLGDSTACQTAAVYTGVSSATERYFQQASDASLFAYAMYGGLRGSAFAQSSIGAGSTSVTSANAQMTEAWNDSITFHTTNPFGADVTFSMTLDDSFGTTLSPNYVRNSSASITAYSYLYFGGQALLSVADFQSLDVPSSGSTTPVLSTNLAGQHTVSTVVHVYDGQTAAIAQTLNLGAGAQANGMAFVDASHTAYFNLSVGDATTSYSTVSGTHFATTGSPFAVSPVPEPSEWALMAVGMGVLGFVGKRRGRSTR